MTATECSEYPAMFLLGEGSALSVLFSEGGYAQQRSLSAETRIHPESIAQERRANAGMVKLEGGFVALPIAPILRVHILLYR